mmetsp:Transcript_12078/g.33411  ORF Transcript_12078/g.33411 Transcript_12078/m.33411 type:complete len:200 (-) Transcript_12078:1376-1975(-)
MPDELCQRIQTRRIQGHRLRSEAMILQLQEVAVISRRVLLRRQRVAKSALVPDSPIWLVRRSKRRRSQKRKAKSPIVATHCFLRVRMLPCPNRERTLKRSMRERFGAVASCPRALTETRRSSQSYPTAGTTWISWKDSSGTPRQERKKKRPKRQPRNWTRRRRQRLTMRKAELRTEMGPMKCPIALKTLTTAAKVLHLQ